ncbi:ankyrin repeat-containing domain protein [Haematococcus lacustris]
MGNTASDAVHAAGREMQHLANQLEGKAGDEKKFLAAVLEGKCLEASKLLKANPNLIYARSGDWHNAWHLAAQSGSLAMLEVLHRQGQDPGELFERKSGSGRALRKPLPGEPPPHCAKTRTSRDTPLLLACAAGHITAAQYLISVGANVRDGDKYGNTVVHYAAGKGQLKILELLLAADEAVQAAASQAKAGADAPAAPTRLVDLKNEAGLTPLHGSVWGGQLEASRCLLSYQADPAARSTADSCAHVTCNGGSTPLHVAALKDDVAHVELLLEAYEARHPPGSKDLRTLVDNYQFTPLVLAQNLKRTAVLELLQPPKVSTMGPSRTSQSGGSQQGDMHRMSRISSRRRESDASVDVGAPYDPSTVAESVEDGFATLAAGLSLTSPAGTRSGDKSQTSPCPAASPAGAMNGSKASKPFAVLLPPPPLPKTGIKTTLPPSPTPSANKAASTAQPAPKVTQLAAAKTSPKTVPAPSPVRVPPSTAPVVAPDTPAVVATTRGALPEHPSRPPLPPQHFICPITNELMCDPVTAADGRNYEREAIALWLELGNKEFPGSDMPIISTDLAANQVLKNAIQAWQALQTKR